MLVFCCPTSISTAADAHSVTYVQKPSFLETLCSLFVGQAATRCREKETDCVETVKVVPHVGETQAACLSATVAACGKLLQFTGTSAS